MHYIYVLQSSKDGELYIGVTNNLDKRIREHNQGKVFSTKRREPFKLIYFEGFLSTIDAYNREKYLMKTGWGRKHLRHALKDTLEPF